MSAGEFRRSVLFEVGGDLELVLAFLDLVEQLCMRGVWVRGFGSSPTMITYAVAEEAADEVEAWCRTRGLAAVAAVYADEGSGRG